MRSSLTQSIPVRPAGPSINSLPPPHILDAVRAFVFRFGEPGDTEKRGTRPGSRYWAMRHPHAAPAELGYAKWAANKNATGEPGLPKGILPSIHPDVESLIDSFVNELSQVFMLRVFPVGTIC